MPRNKPEKRNYSLRKKILVKGIYFKSKGIKGKTGNFFGAKNSLEINKFLHLTCLHPSRCGPPPNIASYRKVHREINIKSAGISCGKFMLVCSNLLFLSLAPIRIFMALAGGNSFLCGTLERCFLKLLLSASMILSYIELFKVDVFGFH